MPIHHVVLFRFHEGTDEQAIDELARDLRSLPSLIPQIASYVVGPDLGLNESNWDFAVSARFASTDHFAVYRDHPEHQAVIRDQVEPITAERHAVQFET